MQLKLEANLSFICLLLISQISFCQGKDQLLRSWIKKEAYSLPGNDRISDTLYVRYSFQKNKVLISFNPGWNGNPQTWELRKNKLTIGVVNYEVEKLTDSTLIILEPGYQRIILYDENYLNQKSPEPPILPQFDNKPLYKATQYITPRYEKGDLRAFISQYLEGYNIRKAITFIATFIVKEDGSVDAIQIIKGISDGFDEEVRSKLKKTSKSWMPATYKGQPVQTQMTYTIKYLDSIVP